MAKPMTIQQAGRLLAHPLRVQLLEAYTAGECSPSDLADTYEFVPTSPGRKPKRRKVLRLGPIGNVSYHTRQLASAGAIKQVRLAPVRGAVEHFYEATHEGRKVLAVQIAWEELGG